MKLQNLMYIPSNPEHWLFEPAFSGYLILEVGKKIPLAFSLNDTGRHHAKLSEEPGGDAGLGLQRAEIRTSAFYIDGAGPYGLDLVMYDVVNYRLRFYYSRPTSGSSFTSLSFFWAG